MSSDWNSFACLTVLSFSVYIILKVFTRSFSAVVKNEGNDVQNGVVNGASQETHYRDLGFYESYQADLNTKYGTKIYAVLSLKSAVTLRRENIKNSLLLLARKHSILRASKASYHLAHACKKQFIIYPEEGFVPDLRFVNTSNWKMILEEELVTKNGVSENDLFLKTIVLREQYLAQENLYINTLLFLFDPVIVDRISAVKFTEDFITMLCHLVNCDIHVDSTRTVNLSAPTEEFLKPPFLVMFFSLLKLSLTKLLEFVQFPFISPQKAKRVCRLWANKPLVVTKCVSKHDTSLLFKYCHLWNCSLTALFIAAWYEIMSTRTGSAKALCHRRPVTVVLDYRNLMSMEIPPSYLSNSSSCFHLQLNHHQDKGRNFGSKMKHCEQLLNSAVKRRKHLDMIWQLKYQNSKINLPFSSPLEIANADSFCFKPTWPFSLHEIFIGATGTSNVNLTLVVIDEKLYCAMHLTSHFSGCADLLNALFARIVQNISMNSFQ